MAIYLFSLSLITLSNLSALEIGCKQGSSGFILRFSICPLYLASALTTIQNCFLFFFQFWWRIFNSSVSFLQIQPNLLSIYIHFHFYLCCEQILCALLNVQNSFPLAFPKRFWTSLCTTCGSKVSSGYIYHRNNLKKSFPDFQLPGI